MVRFRTMFAVSSDLTRTEFLSILSAALPRTLQTEAVTKQLSEFSNGEFLEDTEQEKLSLYGTDTHLAMQLQRKEPNVLLSDTYVLTTYQEVPVLFVQTEVFRRNASAPAFEHAMELPEVIRNLFWQEYGGVDHEIPTDNRALVLHKTQVALAEQILSQSLDFFNPIVYISPTEDGTYRVFLDRLANRLMGLAHVVLESSPPMSQKVQQRLSKSVFHPQHGEILVLLPGGNTYTPDATVDADTLEDVLVSYIQRVLSDVMMDDTFSFQRVRMEYLTQKLKQERNPDVYEQVVESQDAEIRQLKQELEDSKSEIYRLSGALSSYQASFEKVQEETRPGDIVLSSGERDLYNGERKDVLLKLVKKELKTMTSNQQKTSRKFTLLNDLLEHNTPTGTDQEISKKLKAICQDGTVNKKKKQELEQLGFSVSLGQNGHYKIAYFDDRYMTTMSSTPSDRCAGENYVSEFTKKLFGY